MSTPNARELIDAALAAGIGKDWPDVATTLLDTLGYRSELTPLGQSGDADDFVRTYPAPHPDTRSEQEFLDHAESVQILFQFTGAEIQAETQQALFDAVGFNTGNARSFLFAAVQLRGGDYARGRYAAFTRELNKRIQLPTVVLFRTTTNRVTLAFVHRRPNQYNPEWDVLGSVSLIREIASTQPHPAHLDILDELSLPTRLKWMDKHGKSHNFDGLLDAWLAALDIEELNKRFYRELYGWFERALEIAEFPTGQAKTLRKEEHVVRLITRLMFVWFIKEKELVAEDLFIENQVDQLLKDYDRDCGDSYYRAVLQNLFFATLNTEIPQRRFSNRTIDDHRNPALYRYGDEISKPERLLDLFRQTPFINGGLFDCLDSHDTQDADGVRVDCFTDNPKYRAGYSIPNRLFFNNDATNLGLINLFDGYKFTVEENTPTEQEVALDPELLGKVFENLLAAVNPETQITARKETGSYYTPRAVVDYMVDETLVTILMQKAPPEDSGTWQARLRCLLDYSYAFADAVPLFCDAERENIVRAIANTKVLDPAVGSGAFPMGVLHKLTLALRRLDPHNLFWETLQKELAGQRAATAFDTEDQVERESELVEISRLFDKYRDSDFGRKLYLIQNSIYGVDIQSIATQIAKLRIFISLTIEQHPNDDLADNYGIKPLPNLETRFVAADTLHGLDKPSQLPLGQTDEVDRLETELAVNRERHFHAYTPAAKLACRHRDIHLRRQIATALQAVGFPAGSANQIATWDPFDQNANAAKWFDAEYMFGVTQGFDIVIGNPPYVKSEHLEDSIRQSLKKEYGWSGDLYEHFIFSGFRSVKKVGVFSFIANDSFVTFSSKKKIRELFLQNQLLNLTKAPAQTFEASIYAAIFVLAKSKPHSDHTYASGTMTAPQFLYESFGQVSYKTVHNLPDRRFLLSKENPLMMRLLNFRRIDTVCDVLDTGIHSGNVRSKIFFKDDNGFRHRLLQGRQVFRYSLNWNNQNAQYFFCDVNYQCLPIPGIGRGGKPSPRNEYWHFCGPQENHHQPERLLMRQSDDDLIVAYHCERETGQFYTDNTLFTILPKADNINLKFLLGLFNSRLLNFLYHSVAQEQGKSQAQVKVKTVRALPVVIPSEGVQECIVDLVDKIIQAKISDPYHDTKHWESKVDFQIYQLYGLSHEEITIVERH